MQGLNAWHCEAVHWRKPLRSFCWNSKAAFGTVRQSCEDCFLASRPPAEASQAAVFWPFGQQATCRSLWGTGPGPSWNGLLLQNVLLEFENNAWHSEAAPAPLLSSSAYMPGVMRQHSRSHQLLEYFFQVPKPQHACHHGQWARWISWQV